MTIKEGFYRGRAVTLQYGTNKNTGNEQIAVELEITSEGPERYKRCTAFLYFTDDAATYAIEKLRALGWQGDDLAALTQPGTELPSFMPVECDIGIKYEEYQGKERMKVNIFTGPGKRVELENKLDDKGKRAFAAKFNSLAKATAGGKSAVTNTGTDFPHGANVNPNGPNPPAQARAAVKL